MNEWPGRGYDSSVRIEFEPTASEETFNIIRAGMRRHTESRVPWEEYTDLVLLARDDDGQLIGAVIGETGRGWFHVQVCWVDERFRGQDIGTQLMQFAEDEARRRSCHSAYLNTFSYQAKPFYEKLGYTVFGTLDDYPPGHQRFFMSKRLANA
jgi:GNAT superfamily N-acetyltransferase